MPDSHPLIISEFKNNLFYEKRQIEQINWFRSIWDVSSQKCSKTCQKTSQVHAFVENVDQLDLNKSSCCVGIHR